MERVYFDHCRSTFVDTEVIKEMNIWMTEKYWAPAPFTSTGTEAQEAIDEAQAVWASFFGGKPEEVQFGASEVVLANVAIRGIVEAYYKKHDTKPHIITTEIEAGSTVLSILRKLEKSGRAEVTYLKVSEDGLVSADDVKAAITDNTAMVVMADVNFMVGTVQDVPVIGKSIKEKKDDVRFVIDATRSLGRTPLWKYADFADVVFTDAHRIHGPKNSSVLWVKSGVSIVPIVWGTVKHFDITQDKPDIPTIRGGMKALQILLDGYEEKYNKMKRLQKMLFDGILERIPEVQINGPWPEHRSPSNVCVTFKYIEGEAVQMYFDMNGIVVDTGSACANPFLQANHVILALYNDYARAHGSIRLILSWHNTEEEVHRFLDVAPEVVATLRRISPVAPEVYKK
jgi:cysteine desulfurase